MKIVLIQPCEQGNEWKDTKSVFVFPPYALACLSSVTPSKHSITVIDETLQEVIVPDDVDLVGISIISANSKRGYQLAGQFRERGIPVVIGGIHVTLCPDEVSQHCDAVAIGEGEEIWPQIIDDLEKGQLKQVYKADIVDLQNTPRPDHTVFTSKRYRIPQTVMASRGCPYQCSFCATAIIFGKKVRTRQVEDVIAEISEFPKRFFIFLDDNLFARRAYAKKLMKALKPLKKQWVAQAAFSIAEDRELLDLCKEAGCMAFLIGFESVSESNLKDIGKPVKSIQTYKDAVNTIHRAGILVQGSFIFGFDHDTLETFQETVDFVKEIGIDTANFCTLTPIPGTAIFEKFKDEGRIITEEWSLYTRQKVVFRPKQITPKQLAEGRLQAYRQIYSLSSMLRRVPFRFPHFFWFWIYNISFLVGVKRASKLDDFLVE